jgi:hypothetical protein
MTRTDDLTPSVDARGPAAFDELLRREQESVRISFNQPLYLPGVFQIEGYAAEMIGAPPRWPTGCGATPLHRSRW